MDKSFGNAIFEIFEPDYNHELSSTESSVEASYSQEIDEFSPYKNHMKSI